MDSYYIVLSQQRLNPPGAWQLQTIYRRYVWALDLFSLAYPFAQIPRTIPPQDCRPLIGPSKHISRTSASLRSIFDGGPVNFKLACISLFQCYQARSETQQLGSFIDRIYERAPSPTASKSAPVVQTNHDTDNLATKIGLGGGLALGIPLSVIAGVWTGLAVFQRNKWPNHNPAASMPASRYYAVSRQSGEGNWNDLAYQKPIMHGAPGSTHEYHELSDGMNAARGELGSS